MKAATIAWTVSCFTLISNLENQKPVSRKDKFLSFLSRPFVKLYHEYRVLVVHLIILLDAWRCGVCTTLTLECVVW